MTRNSNPLPLGGFVRKDKCWRIFSLPYPLLSLGIQRIRGLGTHPIGLHSLVLLVYIYSRASLRHIRLW